MKDIAERYVLDTNVYIQASRICYGLDFCPGFWQALVHFRSNGRLCSIDRVKEELDRGKDALTNWAHHEFGEVGFLSTHDPLTISHYAAMTKWVVNNPQYSSNAKHDFQQVADGWLVAFAKATRRTVVTLEVRNSNIKNKVPIPNLCEEFTVDYITTYEMIRRLRISLNWTPAGS